MAGKLEIYKRVDGKFAWRLLGDNLSDIVATDGGQGYHTEEYCESMGRKVISGHYSDARVEKRRAA